MKRKMVTLKRQLVAPALALAVIGFGLAAFANYTLTDDEIWTAEDLATKMTGTINLNGHKLTVPKLTGEATITDSTGLGYELLESIESTGHNGTGPYIKTGVQVSDGTTLELDFGLSATVTPSDENGMAIFGLDTWNHGVFVLAYESSNFMFYGSTRTDEGGDGKYQLLACTPGHDYHVSIGTNSVSMTNLTNSSKRVKNPYNINFRSGLQNRELALFGFNNGSRRSPCIFKSLKITETNGVAHTFVPVRQLPTGTLGILDLEAYNADPMSGFHGNAGTGDFIAGGVTNRLGVTDVPTPPGELHINVAAGTTNENTTVALEGSLKLVKEGAGAFTATKTGQTYIGGTEVAAGTLNVPAGNESTTGYLGASGSAVTVEAGATLALDATDLRAHPLVLAGGTLENASTTAAATLGPVTLTADSAMTARYGITHGGDIELGGRTLTVDGLVMGQKYALSTGAVFKNGSLSVMTEVDAGGWLQLLGSAARDMSTVDLKLMRALDIGGDITVRNLEINYAGSMAGTGKINVCGTYTAGRYHPDCVMLNNSTLDLGGVTGAWSVETNVTVNESPVEKTVTFAEGATVNVALGDRTDVEIGDRVVSWDPANKPAATVTFLTVGEKWESRDLKAQDDGLYLVASYPAQATWTGNGNDPTDVTNPANWRCTNTRGAELEGKIPTGDTVVTLPDGCDNFNCGTENPLVVKEVVLPATIGANLDWSGLTAPFSGTLDLRGRKLTVSQLAGNGTITDSTGSAEYVLLDAITSTGTQYIDTGVCGKPGLTASADVVFPKEPKSQRAILAVTEDGAKCWMMSYNTTKYAIIYGSGFDNFYTSGTLLFTVGTNYHLVASAASRKQTLEVNGDIWVNLSPRNKDTPTTTKSMYVFADNNGGTAGSFVESLRLSKLTISDGTTVLRNFVPARRCSDGAVGLLDLEHLGDLATLSDPEFYANKATSGADFTAGTGTNLIYKADATNPPGELHINVAAGTTNENTTVALQGYLKLVKEGEGTFTAAKTGQTYFGGTEVAEGLFQLYNDSKGYTAADQLLGYCGSTVTVVTNGLLNLSGNKGLAAYGFELDGGTLGNWSFNGANYMSAEIGSLKLLSDSYAEVPQRMSVMSGTVDLNEHTLFVKTYLPGYPGSFTLDGTSTMTNGTFNVTTTGGGSFANQGSPRDLRTVKLILSCSVNVVEDCTVGDVEFKYGGTASGNGKTLICGTYKAGNYHRNCEMQHGSTLDLSGQTGTWSVKSTAHKTYTDMTFATNATINVSLGGRKPKSGPIVSWADATTKPAASVTFVLDPNVNARLIRNEDGLCLQTGFVIRIR